MRVSDVLAAKARDNAAAEREVPVSGVVTMPPDASVRALIALLAEHNIGAVVVSPDGAQVTGIVSERDVVRRLVDGDAILDGPVEAIMSTAVTTVATDDSIDDARRLMTEGRFRHAPVVGEGRLTGIISIGDVVKAYIDQVEFERDQLDSYVHQT